MKPLLRSAFVILLACTVAPVASANAATHPSATKQSIRITSVSDHCIDEYEEEDIVYIFEGDKVCKISVKVQGRGSTKSKIVLEYYDSDEGWTRSEWKVQTTTSTGRATFSLPVSFPNQPEDYCYSGDSYTHRFAVAKTGRYKAFRSATFDISYSSAEDNPACLASDSDSESYYDY
jgi:hypothetical protein